MVLDTKQLREEIAAVGLLFDGATGTYARERGGFPDDVELACLSAPEQVVALHRDYLEAGCRAIKTNTFAAHVGQAAGDDAQQRAIVRAAYAIACRAAQGYGAYVFADIGPAPADADAQRAYCAMAALFLDEGCTSFLFETMHSAQGLREAAAYIRQRCPEAFIAVSFAADPDGYTRAGEAAAALIEEIDACADVDAVGLNCVCGAYHMKRLIASLGGTRKLLIAMPNAGYPHVENGRTYYDSEPGYYARQVAACREMGAGIVGGCCGTTPEHMRRLAGLLRGRSGEPQGGAAAQMPTQQQRCKSRVREKLDRGERVILVELDPPKNTQIDGFVRGARALYQIGADAITIADCPIGRARMDACLLACKLRREFDVETLPHMTCRDRNVNATKALLLGLATEGVHNVLAVTGDPVPTSDRGSVKGVFQFNSRVFARFVRSLAASGETEPFFLCGALNVNAPNFEQELLRAQQKEECGVEAFLTQPVLSEQAARNMELARVRLKGRLFGGLFPVVSEKNAGFLRSEVAGIALDDAVLAAYRGLDRARGEDMALRLCMDAAKRISPFVDGFYIMTPFQRVELVQRIICGLRENIIAADGGVMYN